MIDRCARFRRTCPGRGPCRRRPGACRYSISPPGCRSHSHEIPSAAARYWRLRTHKGFAALDRRGLPATCGAAGLRDTGAPRPNLSDFLCGGARRPSAPPSGTGPTLEALASAGQRPAAPPPGSGHSTVLLDIGGRRVLTDPVWGQRASPSRLLGPKLSRCRCLVAYAAGGPGGALARPLRSPAATVQGAGETGVPIVTSLGVGAHLRPSASPPAASPNSTGGRRHEVPAANWRSRPPRRSTSGPRPDRPQHDTSSSRDPSCRATGLLQRRHRPHDRIRRHPRAAAGPFDLVMLEVGAYHPVGRHPPGPAERAAGARAAGRRPAAAGALGHLQPGAARLGTNRPETLLEQAPRLARRSDAAPGRSGGSLAEPSQPGGAASRRPRRRRRRFLARRVPAAGLE